MIGKAEYDEPEDITPEAEDLIQKILTVDQEARYKLHEIIAHPWENTLRQKINQ